MPKLWKLLDPPPSSFYDEHPELPKPVASLLFNRNIKTQEQIDEFLNPDYSQDVHDPYLFRDMRKACERILTAIKNNERIVVHGDYDADGVSASVIITSFFKAVGFTNFDVFLPHRETDGYGVNQKTVQSLYEQKTNLIITCDCGISNTPEIKMANELGMDVIITDHHTIPKELPPAYAIIHPKIEGETYPDKGLAGGGVAFKLIQGLLKHYKEQNISLLNDQTPYSFEKWLLDMVAIASVADMVPLIGESRTLTKYGLIVLNKTKRIGLQKLLLEAKLMDNDGILKYEIDADTIGFKIAPRINAAGRMNHANVAYNMLATDSGTDAVDLAFELNKNNEERQKKTEEYVREAIKQIERDQKEAPVLFVFSNDWTTGIVGLIASKIKEKYSRPSIAMCTNNGQITGSGRSVEGFDMIGAMQELPELFLKFGGHPMACGFSLVNTEMIPELKTKLIAKYKEKTNGIISQPTINIDAKLTLEDINWELYDILDKFKPFGQANPKPKYLAEGVSVDKIECIGKEAKHLRMVVHHTTYIMRKTMGWSLCNENDDNINWSKQLKAGDKVDMIFEVSVNEWNGNRELQLTIVDLKKITSS